MDTIRNTESLTYGPTDSVFAFFAVDLGKNT